ncbi:contactin-1a-like [Morone saxatilis]|uniref:contactin-1a-like n=1 Tax=Morone saxatilis TaxID=34816 RepID=UPI0015E1CE46|nr:contactin-1a-like [Morone saxatilis]
MYRRDNDRDGLFQVIEVGGMQNQTRLDGLKADSRYFIEVQGFSSAGYGPPSERLQIHTKKAPPSQPPVITHHELKGKSVYIAWEIVEPLADEAEINGFKALYRQQGHSSGTLYTTSKRYIELPLIGNGSYVVEISAHTDEGDGPKAQIQSTGEKAELVKKIIQLKESLDKQKDREDFVPILNEVKTKLENMRHHLILHLEEGERKREVNKLKLQAVEKEITEKERTSDKPEELLRERERLLREQWKLDETKNNNQGQLLNIERLLEPIEIKFT